MSVAYHGTARRRSSAPTPHCRQPAVHQSTDPANRSRSREPVERPEERGTKLKGLAALKPRFMVALKVRPRRRDLNRALAAVRPSASCSCTVRLGASAASVGSTSVHGRRTSHVPIVRRRRSSSPTRLASVGAAERVSQREARATLKPILTVQDRSDGSERPRGGRYFIYRPPRRHRPPSCPAPRRQPRRADLRRWSSRSWPVSSEAVRAGNTGGEQGMAGAWRDLFRAAARFSARRIVPGRAPGTRASTTPSGCSVARQVAVHRGVRLLGRPPLRMPTVGQAKREYERASCRCIFSDPTRRRPSRRA
jgi:hypothetical protein